MLSNTMIIKQIPRCISYHRHHYAQFLRICSPCSTRNLAFTDPRLFAGIHPLRRQSTWSRTDSCYWSAQRWYSTGVTNNYGQELQKWEFDVKPFGKVTVRSQDGTDITITPINPQMYPLQNKAFVVLQGLRAGDSISQTGICVYDETNGLSLSTEKISSDAKYTLLVPQKYDVDVQASGSSDVSVEKLQNASLSVTVDQGTCTVDGIETGGADIRSHGGSIICNSYLQGNARLTTVGTGSITGDRIQSMSLDIHTEAGDLDLKAVYADRCSMSTECGSIKLDNLHGQTQLEIKDKGSLTLGSVQGDLTASVNIGDIDAYLADHGAVSVHTNRGDIRLRVPEKTQSAVDLTGLNVMIDDDLDLVNVTQSTDDDITYLKGDLVSSDDDDTRNTGTHKPRTITATTENGSVIIECQDWLSSLNLLGNAE